MTVVSQADEGSHHLAPNPLTGSAHSYATPPIAKEEDVLVLEDVVPRVDHAEDKVSRMEDQEEPLPVPPPQIQVSNLDPGVSLKACVHRVLERINGQRCPVSLVCLWSGAIFDPRDPTRYLHHSVRTHLAAGVRHVGPYVQGYREHRAHHTDDHGELVRGGPMDEGKSPTSDGDGESGPDFSHFSEELVLR